MYEKFLKFLAMLIIIAILFFIINNGNLDNNFVRYLEKIIILIIFAMLLGKLYIQYQKSYRKQRFLEEENIKFIQMYQELYNDNISVLEEKRKKVRNKIILFFVGLLFFL